MTMMNELMILLQLCAVWLGTPDGSNTLFAMICAAALIGVPAQVCVGITLLLHVVLVLL